MEDDGEGSRRGWGDGSLENLSCGCTRVCLLCYGADNEYRAQVVTISRVSTEILYMKSSLLQYKLGYIVLKWIKG